MSKSEDAGMLAFQRLAEISRQRSKLYWIFSIGFSNPTSEFVNDLQNGSLAEALQQGMNALALNETHYGTAIARLSDLVTEYQDHDPAALLTQLRVEYMRLFIGPKDPVIPIYETFHREHGTDDSKPLLFVSPTAAAVQKQYRQAGIAVASRESPDHLVTELEFLVFLCSKEAQAWQEDNNAMSKKWRRLQHEFLEAHLGLWGISLCHQVQEVTEEPFYRYFASLAGTFLHMEAGAFQPQR